MGTADASHTVPALSGGTGFDDPFHDPVLLGIGIAFVLVAIVTLALSGLFYWGTVYRAPPWNANGIVKLGRQLTVYDDDQPRTQLPRSWSVRSTRLRSFRRWRTKRLAIVAVENASSPVMAATAVVTTAGGST